MTDLPGSDPRDDADQCFALALDYIRRQRWEDAANSLLDALELNPNYPHAQSLINHIDGIRAAIMGGQDERALIESLNAYLVKMDEPIRDLAAPARMTARSEDGIVLPWTEARAPVRQTLSPLPGITPGPPLLPDTRPELPHLSAFNPLDQLRVLVWFFLRPAVLRLYVHEGKLREVRQVSGWVASALLWLPLAIPALGLLIGTLPGGKGLWWMLPVIFALYLVSGWLAAHDSAPTALMIASAVWLLLTPLLMAAAGVRAGALIALLFLLLAGFAAGIAGVSANRAAVHLSLGATFVGTVAAVFGMYRFITPIVEAYVAGFILGPVGGPVLIMLAVVITGLLALGITYAVPFLGTYFISFGVEAVLEDNLTIGVGPLGAAALTGMLACYMILAWISFAGGWSVLQNL